MADTLYLIDGHAQVYRAFHALERQRLTAPDGRPTGAAYGFTRMLLELLRTKNPDRIAVVFDAPGKNFRHERYPEYKATRKPTPPDLLAQLPLIRDLVDAYRIAVYSIPGVEADDTLGTLARQAAAAGHDVFLVTGDKDCGQLVGGNVRVYDPAKNLVIDRDVFVEKHGFAPEQLVDVMGLWGDTSDNIPGVPGFGEKTAGQLIQEYGTLETLLERAGEIKGKRGETLRAHLDNARLSKELATIDTHVDVTFDPDLCRRQPPDAARLLALFDDLGFKTLRSDLEKTLAPEAVADLAAAQPKEERRYELVDTPEKFAAFLTELRAQPLVAFDTETTGLDPLRADLVGMSFSWADRTGYYLPFRAPLADARLGPDEWNAVKPLLEAANPAKTGQNLKYDALVLRRAGVRLGGIAFDTLLASHLAYENLNEHNLDALALRHLGLRKIATADVIGSGRNATTMDTVEAARVGEYACEDADAAWRLTPILRDAVEREGMTKLLNEVELPLAEILTDMQATGVRVDADLLARQSAECGELLDTLVGEVHALAGHPFNLNSPKQIAQVLFEEMGLPVLRRLKTGASTDEDTLTELADQGHEIARRLLEYRAYAKLKGTYLDALPALVNPETGRIHATFSQTATATGRLASRDPNLQNIPVRTERGRAIRQAFIPADGWLLLAADYSQVELRMLAHFTGDEVLRAAFEEGKDIHRVVAAELAGLPEDQVTPDMRSAAKAVNFGIIYGQTAFGLATTTGMNRAAAQRFIDGYFARFPRVKGWIDQTIEEARRTGFVKTFLGRRRSLPDLAGNNANRVARAEREAVNTVVQGSAADLIKVAMVRLAKNLPAAAPRARLLSQIHDELLFEAPPDEMPALRELVRKEMVEALPLSVPLGVEIGVGPTWLDAK